MIDVGDEIKLIVPTKAMVGYNSSGQFAKCDLKGALQLVLLKLLERRSMTVFKMSPRSS